MSYKDNWLQWNGRNLQFNKIVTSPVKSYHEELLVNAASVKDSFQEPLDLFFSGGVSSQAILNSYLQIGICPNIYIIKYNNNYNRHDYTAATFICDSLGLNYKTIDFNLEHFFENEASEIAIKSQCIDAKKLILLKMLEKTNGIPIVGGKEPYIFRVNHRSHIKKSDWLLKITANDLVIESYSAIVNRPAVANWFFWSPKLAVSLLNHPIVEQLMDDDHAVKSSLTSSRGNIYKEYWQGFIYRRSQTGFENSVDKERSLYPKCMIEFYHTNIHNIIKPVMPFTFTKSEFINQVLSNDSK